MKLMYLSSIFNVLNENKYILHKLTNKSNNEILLPKIFHVQ